MTNPNQCDEIFINICELNIPNNSDKSNKNTWSLYPNKNETQYYQQTHQLKCLQYQTDLAKYNKRTSKYTKKIYTTLTRYLKFKPKLIKPIKPIDLSNVQQPLTNISFDNITLITEHKLGTGTFGTVFSSQIDLCNSTRSLHAKFKYAIKKWNNNLSYILIELNVLSQSCHPNIINLIGICNKNDIYKSLMEYYPKTLDDLLGYGISRRTVHIYNAVLQITEGLYYLKTQFNIHHYDTKPQNILYKIGQDNEIQIKICDFNLSVSANSVYSYKTICSPGYRPLEGNYCNTDKSKLDIWSLGIVINELITKNNIFHADSNMFTMQCGSLSSLSSSDDIDQYYDLWKKYDDSGIKPNLKTITKYETYIKNIDMFKNAHINISKLWEIHNIPSSKYIKKLIVITEKMLIINHKFRWSIEELYKHIHNKNNGNSNGNSNDNVTKFTNDCILPIPYFSYLKDGIIQCAQYICSKKLPNYMLWIALQVWCRLYSQQIKTNVTITVGNTSSSFLDIFKVIYSIINLNNINDISDIQMIKNISHQLNYQIFNPKLTAIPNQCDYTRKNDNINTVLVSVDTNNHLNMIIDLIHCGDLKLNFDYDDVIAFLHTK
jgi:LIM domain kinase 1